MDFTVIDCRSHDYIRIHRADCVCAKEPGTITKSSHWHGHFDSYYEARKFARSLGERVKDCVICDPK